MKNIKIKINNQELLVDKNQTILNVALNNNVNIPHLCYHPDLPAKAHCGLCLVKIGGKKGLFKACETLVEEGMEIITEDVELESARKENLQKIANNHLLECDDCVWFLHCKLLDLAKQFKLPLKGLRKQENKIWQYDKMIFDQTKCIGCGNCIDVCPTGFLSLDERGKVVISKENDCVNCGQCIIHCPVGAMEAVGEFEELDKVIEDKNIKIIVQFAPSIRTSIGEEFGLEAGSVVTGQLVAALKKAGFDYVFDTAFGADFTTMEESDELIERLTTGENLPAMSSCCPAWVKYLEYNHPKLISNLCTSRSPQTMLGGIIKQDWCKKNKLNPKKVAVVSIMPCVAKKFEISREELMIDSVKPVDKVLTTRELFRFLKKKQIDFTGLRPQNADQPFGLPSGAGVIYGSSGGVFESALRTAYFKMTNKELSDDKVAEIRGLSGIKIKEIDIDGKKIKVCVVSGLKNAEKILQQLKKDPRLYDAIEVMACPGGCIAGGGQPLPTNQLIAKKRSLSLYDIDNKSMKKAAHQNKVVTETYQDFFQSKVNRKKILHTKFGKRRLGTIRELKNSKETHLD